MAYSQHTNRDSTSMSREQIRKTPERLEINVKKATKAGFENEGWGIYPMQTSPRGVAIIINIENFPNWEYKRHGSHVDVENLEDLLGQMDFEVKTFKDLRSKEILSTLELAVEDPLLQKTDMFIACIMSHGKENHITCRDGIDVPIEEILRRIACIQLKDKPKLILFNACRGNRIDVGLSNMTMTDFIPDYSSMNQTKDPTWEDMLIVYSTVPGYLSYRDSNYGSWFIESLVKVFMEEACEKDLRLLLRNVKIAMSKIPHHKDHKQSMEIADRGFDKKLYFNPQLNDNHNFDKYTHVTGLKKINKDNTKEDLQVPILTNTDYSSEKGVRKPDIYHRPVLTETVQNLEKGNYKPQK